MADVTWLPSKYDVYDENTHDYRLYFYHRGKIQRLDYWYWYNHIEWVVDYKEASGPDATVVTHLRELYPWLNQ